MLLSVSSFAKILNLEIPKGRKVSPPNDPYQRGWITTDDPAIEPILGFNSYHNAIINIVKNSYPKFTIGLFGDLGTGKLL